MRKIRPTWLLAAFAVAAAGPYLVQAQDTNYPPIILGWEFEIARNLGGDAFFGPFAAPVAFDPSSASDIANELDLIGVTVTIFDQDWIPDPNADPNAAPEASDVVYVLHQSLWLPYPGYPTPEPPPISDDLDQFFPSEGDGLGPNTQDPNGIPILEYFYSFQVPSFVGVNQAKLRGLIDYDVAWGLWFMASADQGPGCATTLDGWITFPCDSYATGGFLAILRAVENPVLTPPNPPVFANAGPDRTVASNTDVTLDASATFDGFNIGFDPDNENVFIKDNLLFTWEWVDGPVRVDPTQTDASDPTATVNFTVLNDAEHPYYEYKVTVTDQVNPAPSTDSVRIRVVDPADLINLPPVAKIVGPDETITVGSIITLCGRQSCDPDCDPDCGLTGAADDLCTNTAAVTACDFENGDLKFRWQQVNELGGLLTSEQTLLAFQPLSDLTNAVTDWQAITPGKYYIRLLVDDGENVAIDTILVVVLDTETNAATATNDAANGDTGGTQTNGFAATPALCGAGLMPAALAPLAMCALWRRRR